MGADQFTTYHEGDDAHDAFERAVDEAQYERGHGGYTGTIAEKDDYVIVSPRPLTRFLAEALADRLISTSDPRIDDKWGPAGAIPVCADEAEGDPAVIGWLFFGWASS